MFEFLLGYLFGADTERRGGQVVYHQRRGGCFAPPGCGCLTILILLFICAFLGSM